MLTWLTLIRITHKSTITRYCKQDRLHIEHIKSCNLPHLLKASKALDYFLQFSVFHFKMDDSKIKIQ